MVLIIGAASLAVPVAQKLAATMPVIACITDPVPATPIRANPMLMNSRIASLSGHLGCFRASACGIAGESIDLGPFSPNADGCFDLVLDLLQTPLLAAPIKPVGYFAPADKHAIDATIDTIVGLIGRFRKPVFVGYQEKLCAHGAQGVQGCTRCLEVCPADAIHSAGERIAVDARLCQGCSTCVLVCPTGALAHAQLPITELIEQLASQADAYAKKSQRIPQLSVCEANDAGRADSSTEPAELACLALPAMAVAGMEAWLAALALGFPSVALKLPADLPEVTRGQLLAQLEATRALLAAMGLEAGRVATADEADSSFGALTRQVMHASQNKRQLLNDALDALQEGVPERNGTATDLPGSAPFGRVAIDRSACTLCMSCSSLCPTRALQAGTPASRLEFVESRCIQCGICAACCPENAIHLQPRFLFSPDARHQPLLLNESRQHTCPECGNPFISHILLEKSMQLMRDHALIDEASISDLQFCPACRARRVHRR